MRTTTASISAAVPPPLSLIGKEGSPYSRKLRATGCEALLAA